MLLVVDSVSLVLKSVVVAGELVEGVDIVDISSLIVEGFDVVVVEYVDGPVVVVISSPSFFLRDSLSSIVLGDGIDFFIPKSGGGVLRSVDS